ncbi:MAG: DUF4296 domain-containing protein [Thermoproteota archaeon]|nr:DUF4296 domain-containing protein [Thermoproteota archaeon]
MIRCIFIGLLLLTFYSCKEKVLKGILTPKEMALVLWDIVRADAMAHQIIKNDSSKSLQNENEKLANSVFKIHDIKEEQFKKSYSYYIKHPEILKVILDSLNAQQINKSTKELPVKNKRVIKSIAR